MGGGTVDVHAHMKIMHGKRSTPSVGRLTVLVVAVRLHDQIDRD